MTTHDPTSISCIVLCGGASSRMGRPKALLPFGDELLIQRVTRIVAEVAHPIVVVAAPDQELPELAPAIQIARDGVAHRGPLQGLAVGLRALPDESDLVFLTATDVPFLLPTWITRLAELIGDADLAMPEVAGFKQPLAALYRRAPVLAMAEKLLAAERLRPVFLIEELTARHVAEQEVRSVDPLCQSLQNLNTPADYNDALIQERHARKFGGRLPSATVELFGVARLKAGRAKIRVNAGTIGGVIMGLARECPSLVGTVIIERWLHPAYRLCREARAFLDSDQGTCEIRDGETLILLSADVGG
jgi:molybdenum cofactor guanylyltransferase